MKIDTKIKYQNLAQHVKEQLSFISTEDVKPSVIIFVVIMYDLPLTLGQLGILKPLFFWIVLPFFFIIHMWGIRLLIKNPYSAQMEMILFMAVWGIIGAISLLIVLQGMSYFTLHITSVFYYIVISLTSVILTYICIRYQCNKFSSDLTKEKKRSNQSKYIGVLFASPAVGYMLAQGMAETVVFKHVGNLIVIYMFAILLIIIGVKFSHRYFFIKANMEYVKYQPISAKERNKVLKQGVEIK